MSGRDRFAPGGREYEKKKALRKQYRRGEGGKKARDASKGVKSGGKPRSRAEIEASEESSSSEEVEVRQRAPRGMPPSSSESSEEEESGLNSTKLNRKEREQQEKLRKEAAYLKATREGKTPQAKKDLERLKKIRAEREAAKAKREQAKQRQEENQLEAKKKAIRGGR